MNNSEQYHFAIYFACHFEGKLLQGCSQLRCLFFPLRGKEKKHEEQDSEEKKRNMLAFSLPSW